MGFLVLSFLGVQSQTVDTLQLPNDSINSPDSLIKNDTISIDSLLAINPTDSTTIDSLKTKKLSTLESQVDYQSTDSIRFDMKNKKVFLFKEDIINYGSINLVGDYMEIDFDRSEIFARGVPDSLGVFSGKPVFKEGEDEFNSDEIKYNFLLIL